MLSRRGLYENSLGTRRGRRGHRSDLRTRHRQQLQLIVCQRLHKEGWFLYPGTFPLHKGQLV